MRYRLGSTKEGGDEVTGRDGASTALGNTVSWPELGMRRVDGAGRMASERWADFSQGQEEWNEEPSPS